MQDGHRFAPQTVRNGTLGSIDTNNSKVAEKIRTEHEYFARNAERMRYPLYRSYHLEIARTSHHRPVGFRFALRQPCHITYLQVN
jgi:hypothetical protein